MKTRLVNCEVACQSHVDPDAELNGYASITLLETEFGEVALNLYGVPYVRATVLPSEVAVLITEKELALSPEGTHLLVGPMTPIEKQRDRAEIVRGALDTLLYPDYEPLRAACRAALDEVAAVRAELRRQDREQRDFVLAESVPEGMVQVRFQFTASEGFDVIYKDPEGRSLRNPVIEGYSKEGADWMTPEEHAAAAAAYDADQKSNLAFQAIDDLPLDEEANTPDLFLPIPAGVLALYRRTSGNHEVLPETIANPDYLLLRKYAPAIERQGLAPEVPARYYVAESDAVAEVRPQTV